MKGEGNESYGAVGEKKNPVQGLGNRMVYMLAASLYFFLVSQFVGEHHGRSKKRRLSPEASPAAEELLKGHSRSFRRQGEKRE